jgi:hypothetical protein
MLIGEPLPFVKEYVEELNRVLEEMRPEQGLSSIQRKWLMFCLMGIIVTNSVCWAKFERASLGAYTVAALSWVFRQAKIPWEILLYLSVRVIVGKYGISSGVLVADDTDRMRSKSTKRIFGVQKLKDKNSGGYVMGQCIVLLLLVTEQVTIPVGFSFYRPDVDWQAWQQQDDLLKEQGVPKKNGLRDLREIRPIRRKRKSCLACCLNSNTHILTFE